MTIRPAPAAAPAASLPRRSVPPPAAPLDSVALSRRARRLLARGGRGPRPAGKVGLGDAGPEVLRLQRALVKWMPGWEGTLALDGRYGPQTAEALRFFKRVYGYGRDGSSLDPRCARALGEVESGAFWTRNLDGRPRHRRLPEMEGRYRKALARGYPLRGPGTGMTPAEIRRVAREDPERMVCWRGHRGRARMWKRFLQLEKAAARAFPGHRLAITCTTSGVHASGAHPDGRAVDFVLERVADGYRPDAGEFDSARLADLAREHGFEPFDEYARSSLYRTGPHMHAEASW